MGNTMKATKNGTLCAMGIDYDDGSVGVMVGPYFKYSKKDEKHGCYFVCGMEYDPADDKTKVVIDEDNCREFGYPVVVRDADGNETPVNIGEKVCVLIESVEREISAERFPNIKAAQTEMFKRYVHVSGGVKFEDSAYAGKQFPECLSELREDEEMCGDDAYINKMSAYVNDGPNHDNYDWVIREV